MRHTTIHLAALALAGCGQAQSEAQPERNDVKAQKELGSSSEDPKEISTEPKFSEEYHRCASELARVETLHCMEAEYERADASLNDAYRKIMAGLTPDEKSALRAKQRQWLKWLDGHCEQQSTAGFGPVALNHLECATLERIRRTEWLSKQVS